LSQYAPGKKLGGGATGHVKKAWRLPDPKFDIYTQKKDWLYIPAFLEQLFMLISFVDSPYALVCPKL
jgi:hypothetical protein